MCYNLSTPLRKLPYLCYCVQDRRAMQMLSRVEVMERITTADFFRDAPEDRKAELIDGVMIMPSPPLIIHEIVTWLWSRGEYPPVRRALNAILDAQF